MHASSEVNVRKFWLETREQWPTDECVDLGALQLSGSVQDIVPHCVGVDIVEGPGIHLTIEPGRIPLEHHERYGAVIAASSFQFCGEPELFRDEVHDLLAPGGYVYVGMCGDNCKQGHSTSDNEYGWGDELRMTLTEFEAFWSELFTPRQCVQLKQGHRDLIYWRRKAEQ